MLPLGITTTPFVEYTGSVTVAVNVSLTLAVFELIVLFMRTCKLVPLATEYVFSTGVVTFLTTGLFLNTGLRRCANVSIAPVKKTNDRKTTIRSILMMLHIDYSSRLIKIVQVSIGRTFECDYKNIQAQGRFRTTVN